MPVILKPSDACPLLPSSRTSCPLIRDRRVHPKLRRCSSNSSCADVPLFPFLQRPRAGWRIVPYSSICPCSDRRPALKPLLSLFQPGIPSAVSMPASHGSTTTLSLTFVTKNIGMLLLIRGYGVDSCFLRCGSRKSTLVPGCFYVFSATVFS